MTPTEHYRLAERLLADAEMAPHPGMAESFMRAAQVHATLANAHITAGVWVEPETVACERTEMHHPHQTRCPGVKPERRPQP